MGLFGNLTNEGLEEAQDRLGGGFAPFEAAIYTGDIKQFYAGESTGGARSVTVILAGGDFGDREYRETIYVTTGKDKGQRNWFPAKDKDGKETGKKQPLPGFTIIDDMVQATVGKGLNELDFEEKIVNIYDHEAGREMPKSVPVAVEILGKTVSVAIKNTLENQTVKDSSGNYVPKDDGSTRNVNNIEKVFNTAAKMTIAEAKNGATEGKFWAAWEEKNKGKVIDKTSKTGGTAGRPGGAPQAGAAGNAAPRTSLFGN